MLIDCAISVFVGMQVAESPFLEPLRRAIPSRGRLWRLLRVALTCRSCCTFWSALVIYGDLRVAMVAYVLSKMTY